MAVSTTVASNLRVLFENGTHPETGKTVIKTKSFNNVQISATADQLFTVGKALSTLQTLPLYGIQRYDQSEIDEN